MKQIITEQVSITGLNYGLYSTTAKNAPYQLEIYHTKEQPKKNIAVLMDNTKRFSYNIGETVDVKESIIVSQRLWLKNIVMNSFLENFLRTK